MLLANSIRGLFEGPRHNSLGISSDPAGFTDPAGAVGPGFADTILDPRSGEPASQSSYGIASSVDMTSPDDSNSDWSAGSEAGTDDSTDV